MATVKTKTKVKSDSKSKLKFISPEEKILCYCCGKQKLSTEFYMSNSELFKTVGKVPVCKTCMESFYGDLLDKHKDVRKAVKECCARLDIYFEEGAFDSSNQESKVRNCNTMRIYMKNINSLPQHKGNTFNYEDTIVLIKQKSEDEESDVDLVSKWGRGFDPEDYTWLEDFLNDFLNTYACDTPVQMNLYKNIAKTQLQVNKCSESKDLKGYKEMSQLMSSLLNDGNLKPVQESGASEDGLSTYGLWIKKIEENEPCYLVENEKAYEDIDKFKEYVEKWIIRPFANIFGVSKDVN